ALTTVAVLLGLMVGSFLNVVIHRMPIVLGREWRSQALDVIEEWAQREDAPESLRRCVTALAEARKLSAAAPRYNIVVPRSACPTSGHAIGALENIPVLSWIWLSGRCKGCGTRIRARYPLVEALTGLISGYVAWHFGFSWATLGALLFCWILLAATFVDFDTQLLPDNLTLPLLWTGLLFNMGGLFTPLSSAVVGAIAGYLSLWSVYWAFKLATGKEGMGYGDFKLLAAIGAWLGWKMLPAVILLSSAVGALIGIALIVLARHGRHVPIPFGPYLASAGVLALFWGDVINRMILQGF